MKRLLIIPVLLVSLSAFSQNNVKGDTTIYDVVEKRVDFTGGMGKFHEFLSKTMKAPAEVSLKKNSGKVMVQFVVEKDGTLTNFKVVQSVSEGCDAEAVRVLKLSPKWKPAQHNGVKVRQRCTLPFVFNTGS
jgi:protein TonB